MSQWPPGHSEGWLTTILLSSIRDGSAFSPSPLPFTTSIYPETKLGNKKYIYNCLHHLTRQDCHQGIRGHTVIWLYPREGGPAAVSKPKLKWRGAAEMRRMPMAGHQERWDLLGGDGRHSWLGIHCQDSTENNFMGIFSYRLHWAS